MGGAAGGGAALEEATDTGSMRRGTLFGGATLPAADWPAFSASAAGRFIVLSFFVSSPVGVPSMPGIPSEPPEMPPNPSHPTLAPEISDMRDNQDDRALTSAGRAVSRRRVEKKIL
jgi:hypothetical protein